MSPDAAVYAWIGAGLVIGWCAVSGARQGVVRRLVELIGLVVVFLFASRLAGDLEPVLHESWGMGSRPAFFVSWVAVLVGGILLIRFVSSLSQRLVRLTIAGWLDRAGGALMGGIFGGIVVSCLLVLVLAFPIGDTAREELREDEITNALLHFAPSMYDVASRAWDGDGFFEMVREHVEPRAKKAAAQIRAVVEDTVNEVEAEDAQKD